MAETKFDPKDECGDLAKRPNGVAQNIQTQQKSGFSVVSSMQSVPQMIHDFNFGVPQTSLKTTNQALISSAPAFKLITSNSVPSSD